MNLLINFITSNTATFILILIRVSGIFVAAPVFSRNNIPMLTKAALSVIVSLILLPTITPVNQTIAQSFLNMLYLSFFEFGIGVIIGLVGAMYFSSLYLAGTIVDTQVGFAMVNVLDPQTNTQIPIMGNLYNVIFTLIFIAVNGHHFIIRTLVQSYAIIPLGRIYPINEFFIEHLTVVMTDVFIFAFKLSAPILAMIFLANVLLGILARTMPQMNVFIIGMPLKITIGLITILITMQFFIPFSERLFDRMFHATYNLLEIMSRGMIIWNL
ncbi:flagellar biosynthetic protein FliR [Serpentinicella sp. ANB-PHB4]|uniref:flagellar biosynthetic protein FliR n=1 Tax=Serpentinicella sp. ANB-PHB4 TaxID=3074076 RepID=UPI002855E3D9|nr:flagellar biosynthetic protein FliR [Serpentinicella sp. ANB-PHB4]MDR5658252.1 flagellar biosynthetic protein FliR [Serpentinicella sp. ANB-PHB4]